MYICGHPGDDPYGVCPACAIKRKEQTPKPEPKTKKQHPAPEPKVFIERGYKGRVRKGIEDESHVDFEWDPTDSDSY